MTRTFSEEATVVTALTLGAALPVATWGQENLGEPPPGYIGSGRGLLGMKIGYARKVSAEAVKRRGKKIAHMGSTGFGAGSSNG